MKLGTTELVVLLVIVIILFGPTQIPKLTKMFGKSIKGFKDGLDAQDEEADKKSRGSENEKEE